MHHGMLSADIKMGVFDLDLHGHLGLFDSDFQEIWFVHTISPHRFGLESPSLHHTCILEHLQLVLKIVVIDFNLQDHLAILSQNS